MKKIIYFFPIFVLLAGSCTERIDIELDSTYERLVIEGQVTTDTTAHWVRLTKSTDYFSGNPAPTVSNAEVVLYDGMTSINMQEHDTLPGYYLTPEDYFGVAGRIYELSIALSEAINGKTSFNASSELRPVGVIDSIQVVYNEDWEVWEVRIFAWEPPTTDFYLFNIYKNNELMTDTINKVWISDDRYFNGNYIFGALVGFLNEEKPREIVKPGDVITLKMSGITKAYYDFIFELQDQTFEFRNPLFSGPPANVSTNISEGASGFFSAYSNTQVSRVYE